MLDSEPPAPCKLRPTVLSTRGLGSTAQRLVKPRGVVNAMLLAVPLAFLGEVLGFSPVFVFVFAALSCIPLSYWLGQATESLATRLGPASGGLLNATFGNAAEFIISIMALSEGLFLVVRTSLIGSVLGQLFLVLGTSLLVAGLMHQKLSFSRTLVKINIIVMAFALAVIALPTVLLAAAPEAAQAGLSFLTPALALILLIMYGVAVVLTLRKQPEDDEENGPRWSSLKGLAVLGVATGGIVLMAEILVGNIIPFIEATGISEVFVGLILIPIFSNVVDHIVAITVAMKNKMDLSLTISVGSAAQVAGLVLPIIIIVSIAMGNPIGLVFTPIELTAFAVGLAVMVPVLLDGKSNWMEGAQLVACYLGLGVVLWML